MTFREKFKMDCPTYKGPTPFGCPETHGYEEEFHCLGISCCDCWDREMPGTETQTVVNNYFCKGDEKEMKPDRETRKTKAELLEEIAELRKEIERVDQRKYFDDVATGLKMQYDALVEVGFDPDNAMKILNNLIKAAGGNR